MEASSNWIYQYKKRSNLPFFQEKKKWEWGVKITWAMICKDEYSNKFLGSIQTIVPIPSIKKAKKYKSNINLLSPFGLNLGGEDILNWRSYPWLGWVSEEERVGLYVIWRKRASNN